MHQEAEEEEAEDEGADEEEVLVLGWHQGAEGGDEACVGFCQVGWCAFWMKGAP